MNIALIDNDYEFNEIFKREMKEFDLSYRFFSSYKEFLHALSGGYNVEVLLLDIEMPDKSGFEVAKELEISNPGIYIFYITNHLELVYDSFGSNICGFFPKGFIKNQKDRIIKKITDVYNQNNYLSIKSGREYYRVRFINIAYIEKVNKSVIIYTIDNQKIRTGFRYLYDLYSKLPSSLFIYINRSMIVNIKQVQSVKKPYLNLTKDNKKLEISRGKYKQVIKALSIL